MKLSVGLLKGEIGKKIFNNSLNRAKKLIKEIYDIDLSNNSKGLEIYDEEFSYKTVFNKNNREITAVFKFEKDEENDELLRETINIKEFEKTVISIDESLSFKDAVNRIMDVLEEKYDVTFVLLDPEEQTKNKYLKKVEEKKDEWELVFVADHHEGTFKVKYNAKEPGKVNIFEYKNHVIYLE